MERIETLIQNLQQQLASKASTAHLLATAEMLVLELRKPINTSVQKVSVQMPYVFVSENLPIAETTRTNEEILDDIKNILHPDEYILAAERDNTITETAEKQTEVITNNETNVAETHIVTEETQKKSLLQKPTQILAEALEEFFPAKAKINFNEMLESLPTYAAQPNATKQVFELNDVIVDENEESLNDVFSNPVLEVAQTIKETPVKDLRKAIGVNDKYLFINELFKGDEAMYEKCLKTINSFAVYPEAETWIRRELLVKMGWDEKASSTKQFYQIVMRRFL
ncbi:MAG: hypothetical protein ACOVMM_10925 [Chitinophagaceae bacterium]